MLRSSPIDFNIMPNKKPFRVYEDPEDREEPQCCDGDGLCPPCIEGNTSRRCCTPECKGCPNCGDLFRQRLEQKPGVLTDGAIMNFTKSASTSDLLFQVSANNEISNATNGSQPQSIRTINAATSSSFSKLCDDENVTPSKLRYQTLYHLSTRGPFDQQHSSEASEPAMQTQQPYHNINSPSLTGSQDSLIAISPTRPLRDQQRSRRASKAALRTHAEKLRAALACPVDELAPEKPMSSKKAPLKNKIESLWRKMKHEVNGYFKEFPRDDQLTNGNAAKSPSADNKPGRN
ncbi:1503bbe2-17ec-440e-9eef-50274551dca6 [Sclerotinia trifoliorum]|uniref:1503bbe2-17ec-440e-9eef-50274551dca6 n=1 Tax=Sclerotinia trifoliorum TaxID=28548 RepID=A0A8H2ZPQ3_9HELO|nr:1503bbe2-17ec-440e-9eef-50274551dca6 [Sclerotinia trifoliorum]